MSFARGITSRGISSAALLCLPAALIVYLGFNSGGFYPGPPAYVAIVVCVVLLLRVTIAADPFEGITWQLALAAGAMAAFTLLTLLSERWSHAPGTALVEFDLPLIYLLVMVLFGSLAQTRQRLRWLLRILALTITGICVCGLITRILPQIWPITPGVANNRLSFPLTYWNALGLLAVLGIVLCVHLASDIHEAPPMRVLGAAAVPVLATTLYFTFSRGSIATVAIVTVVYVLFARPRGLVSFALSGLPATAVAVVAAYDANLLATPDPTTPAAIAQGRHVALALCGCIVGAAVLRVLLLPLDVRLSRVRVPQIHPRQSALAWGALAAAAVIAVLALSGTISHQYQRFVSSHQPGSATDLRSRLTDPGNNGRLDAWTVAWRQFRATPIVGAGAGTFADSWARHRPVPLDVQDAHSLYMEVLDELGIVGLLLLLTAIVTVLVGAAVRARGSDRPVYAAIFCFLLAWAIHAGVDWDWEMPVITLPFFAVGGFILARGEDAPASRRLVSNGFRPLLGVGAILLAVAPAYVWLSQTKLDDASAAFSRADCRTATVAAQSSISILGDRPDPYEILGYCDIRNGMPNSAIAAITKAISLDPKNWNYRYDLALARSAAGLNPLPAARLAVQMNPLEPLTRQAWGTFRADRPSQWQRDGEAIAHQITSL